MPVLYSNPSNQIVVTWPGGVGNPSNMLIPTSGGRRRKFLKGKTRSKKRRGQTRRQTRTRRSKGTRRHAKK